MPFKNSFLKSFQWQGLVELRWYVKEPKILHQGHERNVYVLINIKSFKISAFK